MSRRLRGPIGLLLIGAALLLLALPALGQATPAEVRLRDARLAADGTTRLVVGLEGLGGTRLEADAFQVLEDGRPVGELTVEPIVAATADTESLAAMLVIDASSSMGGEPIEQIQAAAIDAVGLLTDQDIAVGLVRFSTDVEVLSPPILDADTIVDLIGDIEVALGTALFDGVIAAVDELEAYGGLGTVVAFADGEDNQSDGTIQDAIDAANAVGVPLQMLLLDTERLDLTALEALSTETGGRVTNVANVAEIDTAFEAVVQDISNQYFVRYTSDILEPAELPVTVIVDTPAGELRVDSLAINSREAAAVPVAPRPAVLPEPPFPFLATTTGLWLGIGAAFVAVLALLWVLLVSTRRTAGSRTLERGLRAFGRGDKRPSGEDLELPTSRLTERAVDLIGRVPKPKGFDQRLQLQLDRASWPIRSNEFVVLSLAAGLLGGLTLGGLLGNWIIGILAAVVGGMIPFLVMKIRIDRRKKAFMDQLPQTLQLLAGSLRAGYGLMQAIDTVVKEANDPTSTEFARVLTETRLGMPIDEALEGMARRLDSNDFHWVVLAIGIQRQVGGNLAELLSTVAETMRNRARLRRQILVLSAEGRISAWVIGLMPFVVAFLLQIINPGYVGQLLDSAVGIGLLIGGLGFLLIGIVWLRKIVNIEVT